MKGQKRFSRREFLQHAAAGMALLSGTVNRSSQAQTKSKKLGVALLGLGRYATGELGPALRLTQKCELRGIITGTPAKGERWTAEYQLDKKNVYNYERMDEIARNPDIDIIYVVTPPGVHADFAVRSAKAGKHVISEKPMATSVADCDRMIKACQDAKVKLGVGYRLHYDPLHNEMAKRSQNGDFGQIRTMSGGFGYRMTQREHRVIKHLSGGGPLMDLGIYVVHAACMAMGSAPKYVTAKEEPKTNPELFNEVEEGISWTMEFENGAVCDGFASFSKGANQFRLEGDKGWLELSPGFSYRGIQANTSSGPLKFDAVSQQALQMDDFAECVLTGAKSKVPGALGRRDIAILYSIYDAARTGKRVRVEI